MCGGYAPLKDVYKTEVYKLARWRNASAEGKSNGEVIPSAVIARAPSAELRADQTDQDSLPPYDVLDGILARCIEGAESQAEIVAAGYDADDVQRVVRMLYASEFKRRQSAPGPRVSTCAFGRERRYPVSNAWR
jgi:NAD+ synthase (glutamine-hydrolysing)